MPIDLREVSDVLEKFALGSADGLLLLSGDGTDPQRLDARLPTVISFPISNTLRDAIVSRYPAESSTRLLQDSSSETRTISTLFTSAAVDSPGFAYLVPLTWEQDLRDFRTFIEVIARLRAEDGCPWDRAQTHRSLAPYLLEETYEALEEVDAEQLPALREELGDILLQIGLHSQIADEAGAFSVGDVVEGLLSKLIRRHPHVFGEATADSAAEVAERWEVLKSRERGNASILKGVPATMPALGYAQRVQDRASNVGFDWPSIDGVIDKVSEEAREFTDAEDADEREAEFGDLLFSLVNLGRHRDIDVEAALRRANGKFVSRFQAMEAIASDEGTSFAELPLEKQDRLWDLAKEHERA